MFSTLGLFPDVNSKTKSVFISNEIYSPQKVNKSIIFGSLCSSPHSIKMKGSPLIDSNQQ
jgi:hypothetical protein